MRGFLCCKLKLIYFDTIKLNCQWLIDIVSMNSLIIF